MRLVQIGRQTPQMPWTAGSGLRCLLHITGRRKIVPSFLQRLRRIALTSRSKNWIPISLTNLNSRRIFGATDFLSRVTA